MANDDITIEDIATVLLAGAIANCMEQDIQDRELPSLSGCELTEYFTNWDGFNEYVAVYCIKFKIELNVMLEHILANDVDWVEYVVNRSDRILDLPIDARDILDHNDPVLFPEDTTTYKITRFYKDNSHPNHRDIIKTGLTLAEAKEHCQDPDTSVPGVYFDGFEEE